jgi:glycosidase
MSETSRRRREAYVRFCEQLRLQLPGPTRYQLWLPASHTGLFHISQRYRATLRHASPKTVASRSTLIPPKTPCTIRISRHPENSDRGRRNVECMKLAVLCQFAFQGVPAIYYRDETGLEGEDDPDNRRAMPWEPL